MDFFIFNSSYTFLLLFFRAYILSSMASVKSAYMPWTSSTAIISESHLRRFISQKKSKSPLSIIAATCVTIHVSAPVSTSFSRPRMLVMAAAVQESRILSQSSVLLLTQRLTWFRTHIHDLQYSLMLKALLSGKKFWVYKFTGSHFFLTYNNIILVVNRHPFSLTFSFQLTPLLVALLVPRAGDGCASHFLKGSLPASNSFV